MESTLETLLSPKVCSLLCVVHAMCVTAPFVCYLPCMTRHKFMLILMPHSTYVSKLLITKVREQKTNLYLEGSRISKGMLINILVERTETLNYVKTRQYNHERKIRITTKWGLMTEVTGICLLGKEGANV